MDMLLCALLTAYNLVLALFSLGLAVLIVRIYKIPPVRKFFRKGFGLK